MITVRSHDQFNTTIYGLEDRYRGIHKERRVILMNHNDMERRGLKNMDVVNIKSNFNGKQRSVQRFHAVEYPISEYCAAMYFPEANVLVPIDSVAEKSNTPTFKTVNILVEKAWVFLALDKYSKNQVSCLTYFLLIKLWKYGRPIEPQ